MKYTMQPSSPLPREPVHFTYLNCSTLVVQYKLLVVPHTHTIPILQCTIQLYYTCERCVIKTLKRFVIVPTYSNQLIEMSCYYFVSCNLLRAAETVPIGIFVVVCGKM